MGALDRLPTLAEQQQTRRAIPKYQIPSRLDEKTASDKDDARALDVWRKAVARRDRNRCRHCGVLTVPTLELQANRREIHHLRSRTDPVVRYDVRNGVVLCATHHSAVSRHRLFAVQPAADMFTAGRTLKKYLNGDSPRLKFVPKRPEA
jgi:predicted restriction endonuclease